MSWVRLDDGFSENAKVLELSPRAFRLHVFALCYAARNETDGKVSPGALPQLRGSPALVRELTAARLWHSNGRGWEINDYLKYNPSAEDQEKRREEARERMAKNRGS